MKPTRTVKRDGEIILERFRLLKIGPVEIFLHKFHRGSGYKVDFHNHVGRYGLSIILKGWYIEDRWNGTRSKKRYFNYFNSGVFHRIVETYPNTYTLFFRIGRCRDDVEFK